MELKSHFFEIKRSFPQKKCKYITIRAKYKNLDLFLYLSNKVSNNFLAFLSIK
jgi:hypothetical protein